MILDGHTGLSQCELVVLDSSGQSSLFVAIQLFDIVQVSEWLACELTVQNLVWLSDKERFEILIRDV